MGTEGRENPRIGTSGVLLGIGIGGTDTLRKSGMESWVDSFTDPRGLLLGVGGSIEIRGLPLSRLESATAPSDVLEWVADLGIPLVRPWAPKPLSPMSVLGLELELNWEVALELQKSAVSGVEVYNRPLESRWGVRLD